MSDFFVKVIIEGLHKIGLLKGGLILAFFGVIALAIPGDWLLEQKIVSSNTVFAILLLLGLCMIATWAFTNDFTLRFIEKPKSRREFEKLSNKARMLLLLQAQRNVKSFDVVVNDQIINELITNKFLELSPGHIAQSNNRASIQSEKWQWLKSDLQFAKQNVNHDDAQERGLNEMLEQANSGSHSWMGF